MKEFKRDGITYRYEEETPYLVEVEGDHDNKAVKVDISSHNWEDEDGIIMAVQEELDSNKLNGYSFELSWEYEGQEQKGEFVVDISDGICTIDKITGNRSAVCIYNQPWNGLEDLIDNLHEQDLEDIENHLWDTFGDI